MYASTHGHAFLGEGLGHLVVVIMDSNIVLGMDVCSLSLYVFPCRGLAQADYLSKESCNVCVRNECVMKKRSKPYSNWCKTVK